jgi:hypothetical protein
MDKYIKRNSLKNEATFKSLLEKDSPLTAVEDTWLLTHVEHRGYNTDLYRILAKCEQKWPQKWSKHHLTFFQKFTERGSVESDWRTSQSIAALAVKLLGVMAPERCGHTSAADLLKVIKTSFEFHL